MILIGKEILKWQWWASKLFPGNTTGWFARWFLLGAGTKNGGGAHINKMEYGVKSCFFAKMIISQRMPFTMKNTKCQSSGSIHPFITFRLKRKFCFTRGFLCLRGFLRVPLGWIPSWQLWRFRLWSVTLKCKSSSLWWLALGGGLGPTYRPCHLQMLVDSWRNAYEWRNKPQLRLVCHPYIS